MKQPTWAECLNETDFKHKMEMWRNHTKAVEDRKEFMLALADLMEEYDVEVGSNTHGLAYMTYEESCFEFDSGAEDYEIGTYLSPECIRESLKKEE